MIDQLITRMRWLSRNPGATENAIEIAERAVGVVLSNEYKVFLKEMNGGNARTAFDTNICFFSTEELPEINSAASIVEFLPDHMIFASDLGGKSFFMDRMGERSVIFSCFDEDFNQPMLVEEGTNFADFLSKLVPITSSLK